jgi:HSP20 family molecular chaperone IbpA
MPMRNETIEKNTVNVKTMSPAVLKELEDLRSRMAKRAVEMFTYRRRAMDMELDNRSSAERKVVYRPQIETTETDKYVELRVALPGFASEEVEVFVEPRSVTISGERKAETHTENKNIHYSDFSSGEVFRRFQLPSEADPDGARAGLKDGILFLTLPKTSTSEKKENADGPSAA